MRRGLLTLAVLLWATVTTAQIRPTPAVVSRGTVTVYADLTATGSTGGGAAATVSTYTLPTNTLNANGQKLHIDACTLHAANTNATTFLVSVFGTAMSSVGNATSGAIGCASLDVVRVSSSVADVHGFTDSAASFTQNRTRLTGIDFTGALDIHYTVQAATTTNDLIGEFMRVSWSSQ